MRWWMGMASLTMGCDVSEPEPVSLPDATDTVPVESTDTCEDVKGKSECGNRASLVHGVARLPDDWDGPTTGNLVVGMLHRRYGDPSVGGHPHWGWTFEDVDLTEPFGFKVDMCEGNAVMWSEENCEYNLVVMLDFDEDNGVFSPAMFMPAENEPAALVTFDLSCHADGPLCLGDVELGCSGPSCIEDTDPGDCACAEDACDSQSAICEL